MARETSLCSQVCQPDGRQTRRSLSFTLIYHLFTNSITDWLTASWVWLTDCSSGHLTGCLEPTTDWFTDQSVNQSVVGSLVGPLADWLNHLTSCQTKLLTSPSQWLTASLINKLGSWVTNWWQAWSSDLLNDSPTDCVSDWLTDCLSGFSDEVRAAQGCSC